MRASQLLAVAIEGKAPSGPNQCFFCGGPCGGLHAKKDHVKATFTDFGACVCPSSDFVCNGCVLSLREQVDMPGRDKPQKTRTYSWIITESKALPYSKADIATLRNVCLSPPDPPYAVCISTSGQKHVIFKTPACVDAERPVVCIEGEVIDYAPDELAERLSLVTRMVAVAGKPPMSDAPTLNMAMKLYDARGDSGLADYETWQRIYSQPLSRLAVFLSPSMADAKEATDDSSAA